VRTQRRFNSDDHSASYSFDGERIAFVRGGPQGGDLMMMPADGGETEYVVRTEGTWHVHNGGWSPDSKSLVYTQDQDFGDIYELVARR
jgi:Tol biopolymer transport system component